MQDRKFEEFQSKLEQGYRNEVSMQISRMDLAKAPELARKLMGNETNEREIWTAMCKLWQMLQAAKPAERNEIARRYAVTVTELEKVMGYYFTFVSQGCDPGITHDQ